MTLQDKNTARRWTERALEFAQVNHGDSGVNTMVDDWYMHKEPVLKLLKKSPDWNEDTLSIIKQFEYVRLMDRRQRDNAFDNLISAVIDYSNAYDKPDMNTYATILRASVRGQLSYLEVQAWNELVKTKDETSIFKDVFSFRGVQQGMKYSRLIQKLLKEWDKDIMDNSSVLNRYNGWVDSITEQKVTYDFVVSVNPADYLLMSYGNSWSSCHILNPVISHGENDYEGQFKAGCVDYLVDNCTAVCYIVPKDSDVSEHSLLPKIGRQLFFIAPDGTYFFQSRMYPGGGESAINDYFRESFQSIVEKITPLVYGDIWSNEIDLRISAKNGLHYPDYNHMDQGENRWSTSQNRTGRFFFEPGDAVRCVMCGENEIDEPHLLFCNSCRGYDNTHAGCVECDDCHEWFDMDNEGGTYGDNYVCQSCIDNNYYRCDRCGELMEQGSDSVYTAPNEDTLCESCFENNCFICERCDEPEWSDNAQTVYGNDNGEETCCQVCADEIATRCDDCGENIINDELVNLGDEYYCSDCIGKHAVHCDGCNQWISDEDVTHLVGDKDYCEECVSSHATQCSSCDGWFEEDSMIKDGYVHYCKPCYPEVVAR